MTKIESEILNKIIKLRSSSIGEVVAYVLSLENKKDLFFNEKPLIFLTDLEKHLSKKKMEDDIPVMDLKQIILEEMSFLFEENEINLFKKEDLQNEQKEKILFLTKNPPSNKLKLDYDLIESNLIELQNSTKFFQTYLTDDSPELDLSAIIKKILDNIYNQIDFNMNYYILFYVREELLTARRNIEDKNTSGFYESKYFHSISNYPKVSSFFNELNGLYLETDYKDELDYSIEDISNRKKETYGTNCYFDIQEIVYFLIKDSLITYLSESDSEITLDNDLSVYYDNVEQLNDIAKHIFEKIKTINLVDFITLYDDKENLNYYKKLIQFDNYNSEIFSKIDELLNLEINGKQKSLLLISVFGGSLVTSMSADGVLGETKYDKNSHEFIYDLFMTTGKNKVFDHQICYILFKEKTTLMSLDGTPYYSISGYAINDNNYKKLSNKKILEFRESDYFNLF
jgi:hypothetical protein